MSTTPADAALVHTGSRRSTRRIVLAVAVVGLVCLVGFVLWSWISQPDLTHSQVQPDRRVTLASGLTVTAPPASLGETLQDVVRWRAGWLHRDDRYYDEQVTLWPSASSDGPIVAFASFTADPLSSIAVEAATGQEGMPPLASASSDGRTRIYWWDGSLDLLVTTAVPGHERGLVVLLGVTGSSSSLAGVATTPTVEDANRALAAAWRQLSVDGLPVPEITAGK